MPQPRLPEHLQCHGAVDLLGMTLADPADDLHDHFGLSHREPGPVVLSMRDPSIWMFDSFDNVSTAPHVGCAFWVVTFAAFPFAMGTELALRHPTRTVHEFAETVLTHAISPKRHRRLMDAARKRFAREAEALPNDPPGRAWRLEFAKTMDVFPEDEDHYICGVVYACPNLGGTMTTMLRLTRAHLQGLRRFLLESKPKARND
jgi:hypothetical protein